MSNKANINKGIKLTSNVINDVIKIGLVALCDDAVKVALAIHDDGENQLANKGSYGYGIFHDGKLLKRRTWGRDSSAKDTISSFEPRNKGFEAVIVAGMNPVFLFNVEHEVDILVNTISVTRANFYKYFKKV